MVEELRAFNRGRTLALLDEVAKEPNPAALLGWRPGPGRAHISWQIMHIAVTEEIFATERLNPSKTPKWTDLWPRFRGGSTPDDNIPSLDQLREVLAGARERLFETLQGYTEDRLSEVPEALKARGLTVLDVLHIISWHEAHHQGQAHLTRNLYKASQSK
ncbi:MAG: DinB family protein [Planctomycetota bacterium]